MCQERYRYEYKTSAGPYQGTQGAYYTSRCDQYNYMIHPVTWLFTRKVSQIVICLVN